MGTNVRVGMKLTFLDVTGLPGKIALGLLLVF